MPFQVTIRLRSAWRFFRWNAVGWVFAGFGRRWFSLYYAPSSFSPLARVVSRLFERLLLRGKAQVVGVYETVGGKWKWLVIGVYVEQQRG